ncbi:hypothetical protein GCM10018787_32270 [Streptomyces thermodiastaticus]|nr:hypothetical protein GCM10018787_32270 [Streptomyces thermodiastaticus]
MEADGDGVAATALAGAPITAATAARAAALRRTFTIGGCLPLRGAGQQGTSPAARLRIPRRCRAAAACRAREPVTPASGAFRLTALHGRLTVAGQRRISTGFPPNRRDDDRATVPAPWPGARSVSAADADADEKSVEKVRLRGFPPEVRGLV